MSSSYHVIVVGAGHAGCEAAYAVARLNQKVLMVSLSKQHIGRLSCNPAIGGLAKGNLVREIDALGGIMGKVTDRASIQFRRLNTRKGLAVQASRAVKAGVAFAKKSLPQSSLRKRHARSQGH